jgi:acetyl-CoA acetyltransferase
MTEAFILGGVRTPVGRYGGSLSHLRVDDLLGMTMIAACERVGVELGRIEDIAAGCVNPAHEGMGDVARWAALAAGFSEERGWRRPTSTCGRSTRRSRRRRSACCASCRASSTASRSPTSA